MSGISDREFEVVGALTDDCRYIEIANYLPLKRIIRNLRGEQLEVKFRKLRNKRTDRQNRYLHGVVIVCIRSWYKDTTGNSLTINQAKDFIYRELLGAEPISYNIFGKEYYSFEYKRMSSMNTKEFTDAVELIRDKMAEVGCLIPEPKRNNFITDYADE